MITIVDCGLGNPGSVLNMIRRIGGDAVLSASPDEVSQADKIVLPGVGAFDAGMNALKQRGLDSAIKDAVIERGVLLMGICLGMQMLTEGSDEGTVPGLALVRGRCRRLDVSEFELRVPHMGWNVVNPVGASTLFADSVAEQRFYFVHSYYVDCAVDSDVSALVTYGRPFTCAFEHGQVMGVQFHPEKSHRFGMTLMSRFLDA